MSRRMQYQWAEDDFLPDGVIRLVTERPDDGKTYVMYHGTTKRNAQSIVASGFRQSADGMLGPGVYLSRDLQKASRYPLEEPEENRVVLQVRVNVGKVAVINYQGHPLQKTWHHYGYDTAWVPPNCGMVRSNLEENCVWDPKRIQIITCIQPTAVPAYHGCGDYEERDINMSQRMQYQWAEDDFLPVGVVRLVTERPEKNQTYVMYHGTTKRNAQSIMASGFRQSADGMLGPGVYLSRNLQKASRYPLEEPEENRVVLKVRVNVGEVIAINYKGHPYQKTWHHYGYDTAWVPPNCGMVRSGLEENCVWDPRRIQIITCIQPTAVPAYHGCGAYGYK